MRNSCDGEENRVGEGVGKIVGVGNVCHTGVYVSVSRLKKVKFITNSKI